MKGHIWELAKNDCIFKGFIKDIEVLMNENYSEYCKLCKPYDLC